MSTMNKLSRLLAPILKTNKINKLNLNNIKTFEPNINLLFTELPLLEKLKFNRIHFLNLPVISNGLS